VKNKNHFQEDLQYLRKRLRNLIRAKEPNVFELEDLHYQIEQVKTQLTIMGEKFRPSKYERVK
jgi:uncharacterized protein (DUF3084 family)